jgi:hypothetical protein
MLGGNFNEQCLMTILSILVPFGLAMEDVGTGILWPFGLFSGQFGILHGFLLYFSPFWYVVPRTLGIWYILPLGTYTCCAKKIWQPWSGQPSRNQG